MLGRGSSPAQHASRDGRATSWPAGRGHISRGISPMTRHGRDPRASFRPVRRIMPSTESGLASAPPSWLSRLLELQHCPVDHLAPESDRRDHHGVLVHFAQDEVRLTPELLTLGQQGAGRVQGR